MGYQRTESNKTTEQTKQNVAAKWTGSMAHPQLVSVSRMVDVDYTKRLFRQLIMSSKLSSYENRTHEYPETRHVITCDLLCLSLTSNTAYASG